MSGPAVAYLEAAVDAVREALANSGIRPPRHPYGALYKGRNHRMGRLCG